MTGYCFFYDPATDETYGPTNATWHGWYGARDGSTGVLTVVPKVDCIMYAPRIEFRNGVEVKAGTSYTTHFYACFFEK